MSPHDRRTAPQLAESHALMVRALMVRGLMCPDGFGSSERTIGQTFAGCDLRDVWAFLREGMEMGSEKENCRAVR